MEGRGDPGEAIQRERLRHRYLLVQTRSVAKRIEILKGKRFSFDQESGALWDAVAPVVPEILERYGK